MVVKRIHESDIDKSSRPDHRSRFNEPSAYSTSKAKTNTLCRKGKKDVVAPSKGVEMVELLDRHNGVNKVTSATLRFDQYLARVAGCLDLGLLTTKCSVGHNDNEDMLLDIERSWVDADGETTRANCDVRHHFVPEDTHRI